MFLRGKCSAARPEFSERDTLRLNPFAHIGFPVTFFPD